MAPYCAIPRDYLSDTPRGAIARYGVFGVSAWPIGCDTPSPFLSVSPLESMRSGGAIPPSKGVSRRCLRDTPSKQGKWVRYPPSAILSRKGIARYARPSLGIRDSQVGKPARRKPLCIVDVAQVFRGLVAGATALPQVRVRQGCSSGAMSSKLAPNPWILGPTLIFFSELAEPPHPWKRREKHSKHQGMHSHG